MEQPGAPSPWATVRFRRAKDVRGWALLGIPSLLYPQVLEQLFEGRARFIEKHHQGSFVSVLFEAPVALAADLALRFPAPADGDILCVNQAQDGDWEADGDWKADDAKANDDDSEGWEADDWPADEIISPVAEPLDAEEFEDVWLESESEALDPYETEAIPLDAFPLEAVRGSAGLPDQCQVNSQASPQDKAPVKLQTDSYPIAQTAVNKILGNLTIREAMAGQAFGEIASRGDRHDRLSQSSFPASSPNPALPKPVPPKPAPPNPALPKPPAPPNPALPKPPAPPNPAPPESLLRGDPFQIALLCQGVAVWNRWRAQHPHLRPNLRGAYLNHLDLHWADLHDADLRFAFLFYSDLSEADLQNASLLGADLIHANLEAADLRGASLCGAYLSYANLNRADLRYTDLRGAFLYGAHLQETWLPQSELPQAGPQTYATRDGVGWVEF